MKPDIKKQKESLRKELLSAQSNIANKDEKSEIIVQKLLSLPIINDSTSILVYSSTSHEVDTRKLLQVLFELNKSVYLPSVKDLFITKITPLTKLIKIAAGIPEPAKPDTTLPEKLDLAIIPGLSFDRNGNRLGRGGGWYDRLLNKIDVKHIIGLCFHEQVIHSIPTEAHDCKVNTIITEEEIIQQDIP